MGAENSRLTSDMVKKVVPDRSPINRAGINTSSKAPRYMPSNIRISSRVPSPLALTILEIPDASTIKITNRYKMSFAGWCSSSNRVFFRLLRRT